jgi:WhiB family redox-sensing transcriptional regulator
MKDMMDLFTNEQLRDWLDLHKTIDEAPEQIPCVNLPDSYFPDEQHENGAITSIYVAKNFCHSCPVMKECGDYALKHEIDGLWGGMSSRERRDIRKGKRVRAA